MVLCIKFNALSRVASTPDLVDVQLVRTPQSHWSRHKQPDAGKTFLQHVAFTELSVFKDKALLGHP